jgi:hypothetical protein
MASSAASGEPPRHRGNAMAETLAYGRCLRLRSHARGGLSWRHKTRGTRRQSCEQSVLFQSVLSRPRCWQRTPTLQVIVGVRSLPSEARTAVMRRSISAGPTCWGSGAGADRIPSPARRLGTAAPGRPVRHARTEVGIRSGGRIALTALARSSGRLPASTPEMIESIHERDGLARRKHRY